MHAAISLNPEILVVGYLSALMPEWHVSTTIQERDHNLQVAAIGGTRERKLVDYPMVLVKAWHARRLIASEGCRRAHGLLEAMESHPDYPQIRSVKTITVPQATTDTSSSVTCFQATVQLNARPTLEAL